MIFKKQYEIEIAENENKIHSLNRMNEKLKFRSTLYPATQLTIKEAGTDGEDGIAARDLIEALYLNSFDASLLDLRREVRKAVVAGEIEALRYPQKSTVFHLTQKTINRLARGY